MQGQWIAHPGEWEAFFNARVSLRRQERGMAYPPIWRLDGWSPNVRFTHEWISPSEENVRIEIDGGGFVTLDDAAVSDPLHSVRIPAGKHRIAVIAGNLGAPPSVRVTGEHLHTGRAWRSSLQDGAVLPCAVFDMGEVEGKPSGFRLPLYPKDVADAPLAQGEVVDGGVLIDFRRESFGVLSFRAQKPGRAVVYYGESREEAMDDRWCEVFDEIDIAAPGRVTSPETRALRWVRVSGPVEPCDFALQEELPGAKWRSEFFSGEERVTSVWRTAKRTLELCTREFYLDGIKRDRWVWSGDAAQCVMMTPYASMDAAINRRTLRAVRGKDPFGHINTILDYTFYWILAVREEYTQTGDASFAREVMPLMRSAMAYCLERRDARGFALAQPGDWVYIDWADIPKDGILSAEQALFLAALRAMADMERAAGEPRAAAVMTEAADKLLASFLKTFYDEKAGVIRHHEVGGKVRPLVTRYAAIFAVIYGILDEKRRAQVIKTTLLSDELPPITTPYMRFYELDALCRAGYGERALRVIRDYWGAMLDLGATSFWEQFDPRKDFPAHYAMYGRPYGCSLCHAWGAAPVYLLGRYFAGVTPTRPGYAGFDVRPRLCGMPSLSAVIPLPDGEVSVEARPGFIAARSTGRGAGRLVVEATGTIHVTGGYADRSPGGDWHIALPKGERVEVTW